MRGGMKKSGGTGFSVPPQGIQETLDCSVLGTVDDIILQIK